MDMSIYLLTDLNARAVQKPVHVSMTQFSDQSGRDVDRALIHTHTGLAHILNDIGATARDKLSWLKIE